MKIMRKRVGMIGTNCYLVTGEGGRAVLIDPGEDAKGIYKWLSGEGAELQYIFLTHGHFDHVLAAPELKGLTGAKIVMHEEDRAGLSERGPIPARLFRPSGTEADVFARDGDVIECGGISFQFLHTPGHSRGGLTILADGALFTGDTLFAGDCGRCDLEGGDYRAMLRSLKRIYELPGDFDVYPGHGSFSKLSREREGNEYMLLSLKNEDTD